MARPPPPAKRLKLTPLSDRAVTAEFRTKSLRVEYFLHSAHAYRIPPYGRQLCETDLKLELPRNVKPRIAPAFGIGHAESQMLHIGARTMDETIFNSRTGIAIMVLNLGDRGCDIDVGEPIARLIIEQPITTVLDTAN